MRIAIVKLSALGDIVNAMIVLQFIKNFNHDISIDWIVEEDFKQLLDFHPHINKVHSVNLKKAKKKKSVLLFMREIWKLRKLNPYDIVIDMQGLIKSALIAKVLSSKHTIGFDKFSSKERIASIFYTKSFKCKYSENIIIRNISIVEYALNFNIKTNQIKSKSPFLFSKNQKIIISLDEFKKNIILIPGASFSAKRYPIENFAILTRLIDANFYVIWGNYEEKEMALNLQELSSKVKICDQLELESLVTLISQADLVIGPDTGPTHIAWALNIPSIMLFGPTPGNRNTYSSGFHRVIESDSIVNSRNIDRNDDSIKNIDVEEIFKVAKELLEIKPIK